ncbi:MAG: MBL fold metallo-hydrolase [Candidatus Latescibacteria bacterium]|nr:MBL fold metallo-hydrolase [Candidatus Latescibacterota bacterium]
MRVERFSVGPLDNNLYLLTAADTREAIVVDPSIESDGVLELIERRGLEVKRILLTHAHIDHILTVKRFHDATGAPVWLHPDDAPLYERGDIQAVSIGVRWPGSVPVGHWIADGEDVGLPGLEVRALHTPGHSPGSVTYVTRDGLIVGDVLFRGSVGRVDLPGGDWDTLVRSVRDRLFRHPPETRVCPGHGPETTIGVEMRTNPFVGEHALDRA